MLHFATVAAAVAAILASPALAQSTELRLANCPLRDGISLSDCDTFGYVVRIAATFAPGVVLAIATLLFIPFFYLARYCCNCCGGSKQTGGCCCAGAAPARYSWLEIARAKGYGLLLVVFAVIAIALGTSGMSRGRAGLSGILTESAEIPSVLTRELDELDRRLTFNIYVAATDSYRTDRLLSSVGSDLNKTIRDVSGDLRSTIRSGTSQVETLLDQIMPVIFVIIVVPSVAMGANGIFAVLNIRRWGPMFTVFIVLVLLILVWLAHGTISAINLVSSDLCAEINGLARQQRNVISALITCPSSLLDNARTQFTDIEKSQARAACVRLNATCVIPTNNFTQFSDGVAAGRIYDCDNVFLNCTDITFAGVSNLSANAMRLNGTVASVSGANSSGFLCVNTAASECTPSRCATTCRSSNGTLSASGKASAEGQSLLEVTQKVTGVFSDYGARFYVCDSLLSFVTGRMVGPCDDLSQGLFDARHGTGLLGLFSIIAVFVGCVGAKRFVPFTDAGRVQDEDLQRLAALK
jgi:hypothetical protein